MWFPRLKMYGPKQHFYFNKSVIVSLRPNSYYSICLQTFSQTLLILIPSPVLNAQSTKSIFLDFLSVLSCFYDMYLTFCTIAIFCALVCYRIYFKGHHVHKSLSEPGVLFDVHVFGLYCCILGFWTNKMIIIFIHIPGYQEGRWVTLCVLVGLW